MAKTKGSLALASYDDIFSVQPLSVSTETVVELPLRKLHAPDAT